LGSLTCDDVRASGIKVVGLKFQYHFKSSKLKNKVRGGELTKNWTKFEAANLRKNHI
jgi:hypothetical protein